MCDAGPLLNNITQTYGCGLDISSRNGTTIPSPVISSFQSCCQSESVHTLDCSSGQTIWCEVPEHNVTGDPDHGPDPAINNCIFNVWQRYNPQGESYPVGMTSWCMLQTYTCEGEHYTDFGCPGWDPDNPHSTSSLSSASTMSPSSTTMTSESTTSSVSSTAGSATATGSSAARTPRKTSVSFLHLVGLLVITSLLATNQAT
ncbi:hypothetical protein K402DRAFT_417029 [Aulographum hederae CBS 113979]|uniref:Uncharacterized protein n=1 Tax=Aulographum hederae CBS 113979 TaxID=1176131 RepID=A0A6G1HD01_9PEZI|nr:hypothetical protein K402DRAFT_417029 [Aulographum hederae CBS 113979]